MKKWLEALRSGEYEQGKGFLKTEDGYCCLGVLQHCLSGEVERDDRGESELIPSEHWLSDHNIDFRTEMNYKTIVPHLATLGMSASGANDRGSDFLTIADAIEQAYGGPTGNMTKEAL